MILYGLVTMDFSQLEGFFNSILSREVFRQLLLNSDIRSSGLWLGLGLMLAFMLVVYLITRHIARLPSIQNLPWQPLRLLTQQLLQPIVMLMTSMVAMTSWQLMGLGTVWLRLMALIAYWMLFTRVFIWLLQMALPPHSTLFTRIKHILNLILWGYFLLRLSGYDAVISKALESIQFNFGSFKLNMLMIVLAIFWLTIFGIIMMWLNRTATHKVMGITSLDPNLRMMLSKIVTGLIVFLSVIIALPTIGINLSALSVLSGALGVGFGFGLQKIASNYISGFIILADKSVRIGDRLTVNNFTGHVTKITSRFVVLRNHTGQEALIPNETFVTSPVINESYTDTKVFQLLDVQVAYATDVPRALTILTEAAAAQERVDTEESPPGAFLVGFGENGIDLRVGFWVKDPEKGYMGLFSDIFLTIWQRFNEENIDFPFPQREIRFAPSENNLNHQALLQAMQAVQNNTAINETKENS